MDKAHDVKEASIQGTRLVVTVDGTILDIDLSSHSDILANATQAQRENFAISPTGYGIHWPDVDEDLSIDGLLGVEHSCPISKSAAH